VVANGVGTTSSTNATLSVVPVVAWGYTNLGLLPLPAAATNVVAIAAGSPGSGTPCLALRADGNLVAWGYGPKDAGIPPSATNVVGMAIGGGITQNEPAAHNLALRADGTVVAWGAYSLGQTNVPARATNIVAVAAGGGHGLALRADGKVIGWGANTSGQTNAPASATNVIAIAAGFAHSLALRADGTVVAWGATNFMQTTVPADATNILAISSQGNFSLALRADGKVIGWGKDGNGRPILPVPPNATNMIGISAGAFQGLALRPDRTILSWGNVGSAPPYATNAVAIAAGGRHSLALVHDPTLPVLPAVGPLPANQTLTASADATLRIFANGGLLAYQWQCNGTNIPGATSSALALQGATLAQGGSYSVLVSNAAGVVRSSSTTLLVWPALNLDWLGNDCVATWEGAFVLQSAASTAGPFLDVPGAVSPFTNDLASASTRFFRLRLGVGPLSLSVSGQDNLIVDWPGPFTLQSSTNVLGFYFDLPGATHPYTNALPGAAQQFFRVRF